MTDMRITCANCGQSLRVDERYSGQEGTCPTCQKKVVVPRVAQVVPVAVIPSTSESFSYAGFWKRFVASLIDGILLTFVLFVVAFVFIAMVAVTGGQAKPAVDVLIFVLSIFMGWLYSAVMESSSMQATLGKAALGIKVTDLFGERISFGKATGRHFGKIISTSILFIGFLMVAFTEKKQALHDMMAGCLVVAK